MSPVSLMRVRREDKPDGLSAKIISGWLDGTVREAVPEHLAFALTRWRDIFANGRYPVPLTREISNQLKAERERTGIGSAALLNAAPDTPEGLTRQMLALWMAGTNNSIRKDYLDWVMARWAAMPDVSAPDLSSIGIHGVTMKDGRVVLDEVLRNKLQLLVQETGKSGKALMIRAERMGWDIPPGFTGGMVSQWLGGSALTVLPEHLSFAIRMWREIQHSEPGTVALTEDRRNALEQHRDARLLPGLIFEEAGDVPPGLSRSTVPSWLDNDVRRVRHDYLDWVLARCQALIDKDAYRVPLTKDVREQLAALRGRSGMGQTDLMRKCKDAPEGLSAKHISNWISGTNRTARKDHLDFVLERWEALSGSKPGR